MKEVRMMKFLILQQGNILFFYRPKVQHEAVFGLGDVQHFFIVLKPEKIKRFIFIIIGRKKLPEGDPYFGFVEKIAKNMDQVMDFISEEHHVTSTKRERDVQAAQCIGMGKYLLINHDQHTHLIYELSKPFKLGKAQEEFHLKRRGNYLVTVKNPQQPSPHGVGLSRKQKAEYPDKLQSLLGDYRFIPLNPVDFLNYEGTELLLIGNASSNLEKKDRELARCLKEIEKEDAFEYFKKHLCGCTF